MNQRELAAQVINHEISANAAAIAVGIMEPQEYTPLGSRDGRR
jgi:hypothetical protein